MILDPAAKSKNAFHKITPRPCLYGRDYLLLKLNDILRRPALRLALL